MNDFHIKVKSLLVEDAPWFRKPEMMGHVWSKQTVQLVKDLLAKYVKTGPTLRLANYCLPLQSQDWHAWSQITKKQLNILRYVLRRLHTQSPLELLCYVNVVQGVGKDELTWYLEMASYNSDYREDYFQDYKRAYMGLGMSEPDARQRFTTYHEEILQKHNVPA